VSVQGWIHVPTLTGSSDVTVVFQKLRQGTFNGYTVFTTGSALGFTVTSGSSDVTVTASLGSMPSFFAAVLDRSSSTGTLALYVGSTGTFPTLAVSAQVLLGHRFDLASGSFYLGSGSVAGKLVRAFTGSMDSVSVWGVARTAQQLSGTYNRKVYAQSGLLASWQFNDARPETPSSYASVVRDRSGHRIDGRIQAFFPNALGSGSYVNDVPDPILSLNDAGVVSHIVSAQQSGVLYDRGNPSLIFNLFPECFSSPDPVSANVFSSFALALARHFDRIKLYVNQLPNLRRVSHGDFDQTPDDLLEEAGRFMGWELHGSFANTDALRYFVGRNVGVGPNANASLDVSLSSLKSQLWRRLLLNLPYIYKTKGTAESVQALLRSYGVDTGFVRLKEYARKVESGLNLNRVTSEKSVYATRFSGGGFVSFTYDAPPFVIPQAGLVLIMGDSNSVGQMDTDKLDRGLNAVTAFTGVLNDARYTTARSDPPTFIAVTSSFLAPYGPGGAPGAGVELTMGRDLHRLGMKPYVIKFAVNGASAADYAPTGSYPSTGGNLATRMRAYVTEMMASSSLPLKAVVMSINNDATDTTLTASYSGNMKAIMTDLRTNFGSGIVFVVSQLNVTASVSFGPAIRNAQSALTASDPSIRLVSSDDLAMTSDGLHYAADSYATQGQRFARAVADLLGARPRSVGSAFPQWVGADAGFYGTGTLFPRSWAGQADGDLEYMTVTAGFNDVPISLVSAQGFTLVSQVTSSAVGVNQRIALYSRPVQSGSFVGGRMPTPLVSGTNALNSARIHTFRGPSGTPVVDSVVSGSSMAIGTLFTMPPVTASAANLLVASFIAGSSGNPTNSSSIANASLGDFENGRDSLYPVVTDFQISSLGTGHTTGSGPTSVTTVATPLGSVMAGVSVVLRSS